MAEKSPEGSSPGGAPAGARAPAASPASPASCTESLVPLEPLGCAWSKATPRLPPPTRPGVSAAARRGRGRGRGRGAALAAGGRRRLLFFVRGERGAARRAVPRGRLLHARAVRAAVVRPAALARACTAAPARVRAHVG
jgi:hypothetical protein